MPQQQLISEKSVFLEALELASDAERRRFLDAACQGDAALRARLQALLDAHAKSQPLLDLTAASSLTGPGTMIGVYKLLEPIGEGGMGLVYMAEQQEPVRRLVALKLIKPGMDSKQVIARFEAERQALAMMDHPNIAKVLDAGTTDCSRQTLSAVAPDDGTRSVPTTAGRPYFVMELVRGIPINEFCDQQKLTVRQRLELFIQVCQAVQHAHQKGIIHRDIKPTNLLVTKADTVPLPKVIDFGIAKALGPSLTDHTLHTGFAQLVGTPMYMSPEQAELNHFGVDTRSDVYSLGVLLYELLTGTTPFDKETLSKAGLDEMRRMIREDEPETVSMRIAKTRSRHTPCAVPGDGTRSVPATELDWIVMKALEKDRTRRYESASAFAADIQRYLSDEPVLACPPTAMYRFQKFARKHKPAFATAAAVAACLILGTTVSAWQAVRATSAEAHAERNAQIADEKAKEATQERDEVKALANKLAAKEQQLQRTLYAAHMNLAHNAFEAGAPARLRELLDQHRPKSGDKDLRGFEWHYLNRLFPADLLVLKHTGRVACVTYSPDGKLLATTSDGGLTVWDVQTGDELFSRPAGLYVTAVFSPDGKRVATSRKIWDAKTGQELLSLAKEEKPDLGYGVAFSPDGKQLATGSSTTPTSGQIAIWDAQTGEQLRKLEGHTGQIRYLVFSPDGKQLASASGDKTVKLWDAESGQIVHTLQGHTAAVWVVAYNLEGKRVASASADGTVKLWDAHSGNEIRSLEGHGGYNGVAFSPDGKRVASGSQGNTLKVWDVESGEELFELKGHNSQVWSVAFSPDGNYLASAAVRGTVLVREAKPVQRALVFGGGPGGVGKMAFSPDGKRLTTLGQGEPKVWDTQTGEKLLAIDARGDHPISGRRSNVALSLDGRRLAGGGDSFREGNQWSPNLANSANIWDLLTGEKLLTIRKVGSARLFALSPDGKRLVVTNDLVGIKSERLSVQPNQLFDANTGQEIRYWKDPVGDMVFSPDGKLLAGYSGGKTLKLWDAQTGEAVLTITGAAGPRAFSRDGKRLATASDDPTVVKLWDALTGQGLLSLRGHSGAVIHIAFGPDSKRLATTSSDQTLKVWDTETAQELLTLDGHGGLAFSPDGHRLATGGPGGTVLIYDATPLPEQPQAK